MCGEASKKERSLIGKNPMERLGRRIGGSRKFRVGGDEEQAASENK